MAEEPGWRSLAPILPDADPVRALARELAVAARRIGMDWTIEQVCRRFTESVSRHCDYLGKITGSRTSAVRARPGMSQGPGKVARTVVTCAYAGSETEGTG